MEAEESKKIKGVFFIHPTLHKDDRGYFFESFNEKEFNKLTEADFHPVQDNESFSCRGVLRGLHFQKRPFAQAKLVRVVEGIVYDVAVDLRPNSPTFGEYDYCLLSEDNQAQFFIPKGFAHGFLVLSPTAKFQYKCDNYYTPEAEDGIAWDSAGIDWKTAMDKFYIEDKDIILSEKDKHRKTLEDYREEIFYDLNMFKNTQWQSLPIDSNEDLNKIIEKWHVD